MVSLGILVVLASMISGVISTLAQKNLSKYFGKSLSPICTVGIGALPMIIGIIIYGAGMLPSNDILISLASGLFLSLGFILRYESLYTEQLTKINVLGQSQTVIVVLVGIFFFNESITLIGAAGLVMILLGSVFIMGGEGLKINKKLIPSFLGSSSWGIYWIMLISVINGTSNVLLSLFLSRVFAVFVLLIFMWFRRKEIKAGTKALHAKDGASLLPVALAFAIATGVFNGIGDTLFGVVSYLKIAAIGSAISSATGIIILSVISYFVYKDRLDRVELAGFAIMLIGAFIISLYS